MSHTITPRLALVLATALASLAATAGTAQAAGCSASYSAQTHVLTIDGCSADPDAPTLAAISRTPAGAILLDGQAIAGDPTVTNTSSIDYVGQDGNRDVVTIDMSNGRFAPGFGPEIDGGSEIEITVDGGTGPVNSLVVLGDTDDDDQIRVGSSAGLNVNDDEDSDITRNAGTMTGGVTIDGQGGNDVLSGGGFGQLGSSTRPLELRGGVGDDSLRRGNAQDALLGGDGVDEVVSTRNADHTLTDSTLAAGNDSDSLESIERADLSGGEEPNTLDVGAFNGNTTLRGLGGDDTLLGGSGEDTLRGGDGNDDHRGRAADDDIDGGPGTDIVTVGLSGNAVLTDSSVTGAGTDSLASIERGRLFGDVTDQTFDASGFTGSTEIVAGPGADTVIGGTGADTLEGSDGPDAITGGPGVDSFDGGPGDDRTFSADALAEQVNCAAGTDTASADDVDALTDCEQVARVTESVEPPPVNTPPVVPPVVPPVDTTAPSLSRLALDRRTFSAAPRGAALATARIGTRVRFALSEAATVTFRIERAARGRRAGGRCQAPSARNRRGRPCTRYVQLRGALSHAGVAGANRVTLRGRLGRRALRPGRYRLAAHATDAAGNRSAVRRSTFRIVRR